jgi:hypothetical protein
MLLIFLGLCIYDFFFGLATVGHYVDVENFLVILIFFFFWV